MRRLTAATVGLLVSWTVHDLEEVLTMGRSSRRMFARLPHQVPLPDGWREHGLPRDQVLAAVGLVGVTVAAASADGYRTGGRSGFYRAALLGYGVHGFGHVAGSLLTRGYTSGVATAPVCVIGFWWWAERTLRAEQVPGRASPRRALALLGVVPAAHLLAHAVLSARRARR